MDRLDAGTRWFWVWYVVGAAVFLNLLPTGKSTASAVIVLLSFILVTLAIFLGSVTSRGPAMLRPLLCLLAVVTYVSGRLLGPSSWLGGLGGLLVATICGMMLGFVIGQVIRTIRKYKSLLGVATAFLSVIGIFLLGIWWWPR